MASILPRPQCVLNKTHIKRSYASHLLHTAKFTINVNVCDKYGHIIVDYEVSVWSVEHQPSPDHVILCLIKSQDNVHGKKE